MLGELMAREVFGNEGPQNFPILFLRNIEDSRVQLVHEPLGGLHRREGMSGVFLRVQRTPPPPVTFPGIKGLLVLIPPSICLRIP